MNTSRSDPNAVEALQHHQKVYLDAFSRIWGISSEDDLIRTDIGLARSFTDYSITQNEAIRKQNSAQERQVPHHATQTDHTVGVTPEIRLIKDVLNRRIRRLFIIGNGGTGKTELSRHLAWQLARHLDPYATQPLIPIWIQLNALPAGNEPLLARLLAHDETVIGHSFGALVPDAHFVFILDGLDELNPKCSRAEFDSQLGALEVSRDYSSCSFVITGRPGIFDGLIRTFSKATQFELQPLSMSDAYLYIKRYFDSYHDRELGKEVIRAVQRAATPVRALLQQPFMLALTCRLFRDSPAEFQLLANPSMLLERGLRRLFERRTYHSIRNPSGTLHMSTDACFDSLGILFANSVDSIYRIDETQAVEILASLTANDESQAECRLSDLTVGSGVFIRVEDGYRFTNRIVAEYLASRWIAKHGLLDSSRLRDPREADCSIMAFYSDHVWSNNHRSLLRSLCLVLATKRPELLLKILRWLTSHLVDCTGQKTGHNWRDDSLRSLIGRFMDCLGALYFANEPLRHKELPKLTQVLMYLVPFWDWDFCDEISGFAPEVKQQYRNGLLGELASLATNAEHADMDLISQFANALAVGWSGDFETGQALCRMVVQAHNTDIVSTLADALATGWAGDTNAGKLLMETLANEQNPWAIPDLANALATGWPQDPKIGQSLCQKLMTEEHLSSVSGLAYALAKGWAGDFETGQVLSRILLEAEGPIISDLVTALATGWSGDREIGQVLCQKLWEKRDSLLVVDIVPALARGWPKDPTLGTLLRKQLRKEKNCWKVSTISKALSTGWSGDLETGRAIKRKLVAATDPIARYGLATALANGWPEHKSVFIPVLKQLLNDEDDLVVPIALSIHLATGWTKDLDIAQSLRQKLVKEKDSIAIDAIADALAKTRAGDFETGQVLRRKLLGSKGEAISYLASALATGWVGDMETGQLLCQILAEEKEAHIIGQIAMALAHGWSNTPGIKEMLHQRLAEEIDPYITQLLREALVEGWPGDPTAIRLVQNAHMVSGVSWPGWVILIGPIGDGTTGLSGWANHCGWKFPVEPLDDPKATSEQSGVDNPVSSSNDAKPKEKLGFILAPREELRPGLDPTLDAEYDIQQKTTAEVQETDSEDPSPTAQDKGVQPQNVSKEQTRKQAILSMFMHQRACWRAIESFEWAQEKDFTIASTSAAYKYIKAHACPIYEDPKSMPSWSAWSKALTRARGMLGEQECQLKPRSPTGSSVVRSSQL